LLKGLRAEEKERYGLTAADNYFYLNQVWKKIKNKNKTTFVKVERVH
jgi:hypothetical protein